MTVTKSSSPAPKRRTPRRRISLSPDLLDTSPAAATTPEATAAEAVQPAAEETKPAAKTTRARRPRKTATAAAPTPVVEPQPDPPTPAPPVNPDAYPGEEFPGEPSFKMTVNIPQSLHQRASGIVAFAQYNGEPEEIRSLTDLVRNSLARMVTDYETKFNEGNHFRTPKQLRRGRR